MKAFVIKFLERMGEKNFPLTVLWEGETFEKALHTFYHSFDENDRKKVSEVRIYDLIEITLPEEVHDEIRR